MPSASAISVTVAPEASALAILVRRPSRRSSAVDAGLTGSSMAGVFLFTACMPIGMRISRCALFNHRSRRAMIYKC